jgi:DNA helicase-2/ATP-dependent DNA helicase PcrA
MKAETTFDEAYAQLNAKQKEAVEAVYGPVMVIAGPGTGKTQILAVRIAHILKTVSGAKPDEIVALTYTESAVTSMRKRLTTLIGALAYRVRIYTFHGFAKVILDMRPDLFPRISYGTQLTDISSITLIEELLDQGSYILIRNPKQPYRMAKTIKHFISQLKQARFTPETYRVELTAHLQALENDPDRIHIKGAYKGKEKADITKKRDRLHKHLEVADLFAAYTERLEKDSLYDYEDLIGEAVRVLMADEDFRGQVGESMQFVLADEHQDTNPLQNTLLDLVTDFDGLPNLFVVGDEKQAIYGFQGATLSSFREMRVKYPSLKTVVLDTNYRSTKQILSAAHDLIAPSLSPEDQVILTPERGEGPRITVVAYDTPLAELQGIAAHITELTKRGVEHTDIAILTRKNADVLSIAEYLRSVGIPEDHATAELDALAHPSVQLFVSLIRAVTNPLDTGALARGIFIPGIPVDLSTRLKVISQGREGKPLGEILLAQGGDVGSWWRNVSHLGLEARTTPAMSWIAQLASISGFLGGILATSESQDAYEAYEAFMEEVRTVVKSNPSATAADILTHLDLIETHELSIKRARLARSGVSVMTAHHSKGMEFPYVVIAGATEETWFSKRASELSLIHESDDDEDETRRLLYVALTRAKKEVYITYATANEDARSRSPLRYLADIAEHVDEGTKQTTRITHIPHVPNMLMDTDFLKERFLARGFSPTGFNNYKKSPWLYLFRTLLQIPDAPNNAMQYGTAIHAGLRSYAEAGAGADKIEEAVLGFERELGKLAIPERDRTDLIAQGYRDIRAYLAEAGETMKQILKVEFPVTVPFDIDGIGTITLSGKLDRIDGSDGGPVTVIDYKTGSAKSENEIRGLTKDASGDYYRQLVFYKLLLERDGRYKMGKGALHFVEPTDSGKIVIREFSISDEEVRDLEKDLAAAAKSIVSGEAFKTPPEPKDIPEYKDVLSALF